MGLKNPPSRANLFFRGGIIMNNNKKELYPKKQQRYTARAFARMNRRSRKSLSLLFRVFLLFTAAISFTFIGYLYKCSDDTYTKDYDKRLFCQQNDTRLSVRRKDRRTMTETDLKKIRSVKNVLQADSQDYAADVNYYTEEGTDYVYHHKTTSEDDKFNKTWEYNDWNSAPMSTLASEKIPDFKKRDKFMRSTDCISRSDLSVGRMPKKRNEIALYPAKGIKLGDKQKIYFTADNIWDQEYYMGEMEVVGFLREPTTQIYFTPDFCHMLTASADGDSATLDYYPEQGGLYSGNDWFILTIGEGLQQQEEKSQDALIYARVSRNYIPNLDAWTPQGMPLNGPVEDVVPGICQLSISVNPNRKDTPKILSETAKKSPIGTLVLGDEMEEDRESCFNSHSGKFMEVSEETFRMFYPRRSHQASAYIENYTKTDEVISALDKMGYHAISTYRVGSVKYNERKVMNRIIFIGISLGILVLLLPAQTIILRSMMKLRLKDFSIMRALGMPVSVMCRITYYEMLPYCIEAMILTAASMILLAYFHIPAVNGIIIYYCPLCCATYILYNFLLIHSTIWAFNRTVTKIAVDI